MKSTQEKFLYYFTKYVILLLVPIISITAFLWFWAYVSGEKSFLDSIVSLFTHPISVAMIVFFMIMPMVFSYSVPGVAMKRYRLWQWNIPSFQLALCWSGYATLALLFAIAALIPLFLSNLYGPSSLQDILVKVVVFLVSYTSIFTISVGILDYCSLKTGLLVVYNRAYYKKLGPWSSLRSYIFSFLGLVGLTKSIAFLAYVCVVYWCEEIVDISMNDAYFLYVFAAVIIYAIIVIMPFYLYIRHIGKKKLAWEKSKKGKT